MLSPMFSVCINLILKSWEQRSGNEAMCVCVWMYARVNNNYEVWSINKERNMSLQCRYMSAYVCVCGPDMSI